MSNPYAGCGCLLTFLILVVLLVILFFVVLIMGMSIPN